MRKYILIIVYIGIFMLFPNISTGVETSAKLSIPAEKDRSGQVLNQESSDNQTNKSDITPPASSDNGSVNSTKSVSEQRANNPQDAQKIFEESLRQMMPLDEEQIHKFRMRSDEREKAILPVSPALSSRSVRVSLEPGQNPVSVHTTANVATSLVFHDSTGQPWPITSVTNGSPSFFQILRPELPDGNLLNVTPTQSHATSTLVVTLQDRDVPLLIRLESDSVRGPKRNADALVLFQLAHHGPKASIPLLKEIKETANSNMLAFLDRVPPENSIRLTLSPASADILGWEYEGKRYLRTRHSLVWPAWLAVVNGPGNVKCYEVAPTSRVMLSVDGEIQTIQVKKGAHDGRE